MPAIGIVFLLAQIACAVHVVRTGRNTLWVYLVVFVPVVGMAAYFFAEILPELMQSRGARQAITSMISSAACRAAALRYAPSPGSSSSDSTSLDRTRPR